MEEQVMYHRGALAQSKIFKERVKRASVLMEGAGLDAVLLTKPQNMMYLVGDGRLCAFTIVSKRGETYVGVCGARRCSHRFLHRGGERHTNRRNRQNSRRG